MNQFTLILSEIIRRNDISRKRLQELTDVGYPAISKYLNGKATPKPPILAKIMNELPHDDAAELFTSYLKELFPAFDDIEDIISLQPRTAASSMAEDKAEYGVNKKSKEELEHLTEIENTLAILRELAHRKPEIASMLKAILNSLKPD